MVSVKCGQGIMIMVHEQNVRCFQVLLIEWLFNEWISIELNVDSF